MAQRSDILQQAAVPTLYKYERVDHLTKGLSEAMKVIRRLDKKGKYNGFLDKLQDVLVGQESGNEVNYDNEDEDDENEGEDPW
jgi:transcription elongation factor Elf1